MFTNPTTPNLTDYVSFLSGVAGIPPAANPQVFPTVSGFASGGDTVTLNDIFQSWTLNQWSRYTLVDTTQNVTVAIASNGPGTLIFVTPLANPILAGDAYLIVPDIVVTSLSIAQAIVNTLLNQASPTIYTLAVYNLATDRLINFAMDAPNQTFFLDLRKSFRLTEVSVGVPSQASDQGTAVGILNPEQFKLLTLQDLQTLRTPFGRAYMGFAQMVGRTMFGLT